MLKNASCKPDGPWMTSECILGFLRISDLSYRKKADRKRKQIKYILPFNHEAANKHKIHVLKQLASLYSLWTSKLTGFSIMSPLATTMQVKVRWSASLASESRRLKLSVKFTRPLYSSVAVITTFWLFFLTSRSPESPSPLFWREK